MRVVEVLGDRAIAELSGIRREIGLMLLPNVKVGDYVIVHAGFAIQKIDEEQARQTLRFYEEMTRPVKT